MALRALAGKIGDRPLQVTDRTSVVKLYRNMVKELPRVMTIYDVDIPLKSATAALGYHFRLNSKLQDGRVIGLLIAKGYMELEETLKQWKQKTHLLHMLEPRGLEQQLKKPLTLREKLCLGIEEDEDR
mmetsp:Transcript_30041/g.28708  ORF Transcript_30041/g.28708 Transcript_30041/m.28708 type:complete len:128 (+) Transcript_30041:113-496(+)